jgi:hypothetical protein
MRIEREPSVPEQPPWRDIAAARDYRLEEPSRGFFEYASRNPCAHCRASYCCWYLGLDKLRPNQFSHFDTLHFYLNYPNMEILVEPNGQWGIYLRQACRHLSETDHRCTIRGTPKHPRVCSMFNPYSCFYKTAISGQDPASRFVRLDRSRFLRVVEHIKFTTFGTAVYVPNVEEVRTLADPDEELEPPSGGAERGGSGAGFGAVSARPTLSGPCSDCTGICCRYVFFWRKPIATASDMDFIRYAMGFPGVAYVISADRCAIVVQGTCRHWMPLTRTCGVVGSPLRPKRCEFLNEWRCSLREQFYTHPERLVHVRTLEDVARLEDLLGFDGKDEPKKLPSVAHLQDALGRPDRL